eukprot:Hpha_TRINITY_DN20113_c0_g1::TRINITY_DN20113_c0_g1_i1::g.82488::m.82488
MLSECSDRSPFSPSPTESWDMTISASAGAEEDAVRATREQWRQKEEARLSGPRSTDSVFRQRTSLRPPSREPPAATAFSPSREAPAPTACSDASQNLPREVSLPRALREASLPVQSREEPPSTATPPSPAQPPPKTVYDHPPDPHPPREMSLPRPPREASLPTQRDVSLPPPSPPPPAPPSPPVYHPRNPQPLPGFAASRGSSLPLPGVFERAATPSPAEWTALGEGPRRQRWDNDDVLLPRVCVSLDREAHVASPPPRGPSFSTSPQFRDASHAAAEAVEEALAVAHECWRRAAALSRRRGSQSQSEHPHSSPPPRSRSTLGTMG